MSRQKQSSTNTFLITSSWEVSLQELESRAVKSWKYSDFLLLKVLHALALRKVALCSVHTNLHACTLSFQLPSAYEVYRWSVKQFGGWGSWLRVLMVKWVGTSRVVTATSGFFHFWYGHLKRNFFLLIHKRLTLHFAVLSNDMQQWTFTVSAYLYIPRCTYPRMKSAVCHFALQVVPTLC